MSILFLAFIFILGLIIGSFINCLVWRLYKEETVWGRSYCPKCRQQIAWYDNIPVLSFLLLKGKCRHCQQRISGQYPIVELLLGILFVLAYGKIFGWQLVFVNDQLTWAAASGWLLIKIWLAIVIMAMIFIYDARWYLVSTSLIIVAAILFLILDIFIGLNLFNLLIALIIGIGFFGLQYLLTRGRGLGEGDIWIGGLMAIIFPEAGLLLTALFLSYMIGGVAGVILLIGQKKGLKSKLPLGIFLALGTILTLFFGQNILVWYLGLLHR